MSNHTFPGKTVLFLAVWLTSSPFAFADPTQPMATATPVESSTINHLQTDVDGNEDLTPSQNMATEQQPVTSSTTTNDPAPRQPEEKKKQSLEPQKSAESVVDDSTPSPPTTLNDEPGQQPEKTVEFIANPNLGLPVTPPQEIRVWLPVKIAPADIIIVTEKPRQESDSTEVIQQQELLPTISPPEILTATTTEKEGENPQIITATQPLPIIDDETVVTVEKPVQTVDTQQTTSIATMEPATADSQKVSDTTPAELTAPAEKSAPIIKPIIEPIVVIEKIALTTPIIGTKETSAQPAMPDTNNPANPEIPTVAVTEIEPTEITQPVQTQPAQDEQVIATLETDPVEIKQPDQPADSQKASPSPAPAPAIVESADKQAQRPEPQKELFAAKHKPAVAKKNVAQDRMRQYYQQCAPCHGGRPAWAVQRFMAIPTQYIPHPPPPYNFWNRQGRP